jgi:hypothetical protein
MANVQNERQTVRCTRRVFLGVCGGAALGGLGLAHYAWQVEPQRLLVSEISLPAPVGAPVRLAFVSDLHLGPYVTLAEIERVVDTVNTLAPDLVLLGGDYVSRTAQTMLALAGVLARLAARAGVYAVLGNHDLWTDRELVQRGLEATGARVLVNAGEVVETPGGPQYLAGLDDAWSGQPNYMRAMAAHRAGLPTILLQHEPDPAAERADDARLLLQLAGHTHGGQVRLPLIGAPVLPLYGRRYVAGLYAVGHSHLYVTRGIGVITPPVRFNCPPEVALFTLTPQAAV